LQEKRSNRQQQRLHARLPGFRTTHCLSMMRRTESLAYRPLITKQYSGSIT
jgi:hypothetical protein